MRRRPAVVVHGYAHARAALVAACAAGVAVRLVSAPGAGAYGGAGWWAALVSQMRAEFPDAKFEAMLDCGGEAGRALAALGAGVEAVVFTGRGRARTALAAIAAQRGARLVARPRRAVDLAGRDAAAALREHFADRRRLKTAQRCGM